MAVEADTSPGGQVSVRVSCTVDLADLTVLGLPGSTTLHGRAVEPVDHYRSGRVDE